MCFFSRSREKKKKKNSRKPAAESGSGRGGGRGRGRGAGPGPESEQVGGRGRGKRPRSQVVEAGNNNDRIADNNQPLIPPPPRPQQEQRAEERQAPSAALNPEANVVQRPPALQDPPRLPHAAVSLPLCEFSFLDFFFCFPLQGARQQDADAEEWDPSDGDEESDAGRLFRALKHPKVQRALKRVLQRAEQAGEQESRAVALLQRSPRLVKACLDCFCGVGIWSIPDAQVPSEVLKRALEDLLALDGIRPLLDWNRADVQRPSARHTIAC